MTYSSVRLTTTADTAVSTVASGINTVSSVPAATNFDFVRLVVDTTNHIITGVKSDNSEVTFESGATLNISIVA